MSFLGIQNIYSSKRISLEVFKNYSSIEFIVFIVDPSGLIKKFRVVGVVNFKKINGFLRATSVKLFFLGIFEILIPYFDIMQISSRSMMLI
jgi:hypothetical protein